MDTQQTTSTTPASLSHTLTQHAARAHSLPTLPPYPSDLVSAIKREARALDRANALLLQSQSQTEPRPGHSQAGFDPAADPPTACALLANHLTLRRHKRCLLAFGRARARRLEERAWRGEDMAVSVAGDALGPGDAAAAAAAGALSPEEAEYTHLYSELLAGLKGVWADVDLTGGLEPPGGIFVDVRCVRDAGVVETEYGSIALTRNSQYYVRRADVERLIAQGFLELIDDAS